MYPIIYYYACYLLLQLYVNEVEGTGSWEIFLQINTYNWY